MDGHNGKAQPFAYWPVIFDRTRLRKRRLERGLSQDRPAFRSGASLKTIQRAESLPTASRRTATLRQLAMAISAEPDTLIRELTRGFTTTPDGGEPRQQVQRRRDGQWWQRAKPFPAGRTGYGRYDIATAREPLNKAAGLMFPPPWGILPPLPMMTRPSCTEFTRDRHARLPVIWWRLFRTALREGAI